MIHADHLFACRLESLITAEFRRLCTAARRVFPQSASECLEVGDGVALWLGTGSPVNEAVGMGMRGPVDEGVFERLESFYHDRDAAAVMGMCPLADSSLLHLLARRGWSASGFEHVLALELERAAIGGAVLAPVSTVAQAGEFEVRVCLPEERRIWGRVAAQSFAEGAQGLGAGHDEFGAVMAERDDAILVLAWVDGEPAGTGALVVDGGVGWLSGDSTLPRYRRRGIQRAIQGHRIELAREAGCDLAVTETAPGSQSQRNMERLGFHIVYTHVEFTKPQ